MAENFTIEAPDFERIRKESGRSTADAMNLLWLALNLEAKQRRTGVRTAIERWQKLVGAAAPSTQQNNYDPRTASVLRFDNASGFTLTGLRRGVEGSLLLIVALGAGTVTLEHNSASSDARNRILLAGAVDLGITTNRSVFLAYLNTRWRELKWM